MSAAQLLAWIVSALLTQLVVGAGLAFWHRRARVSEAAGVAEPEAPQASAGAWPGWRDFRVLRREYEDASQTQCSFHLQPVDRQPLAPFLPGQYLTFSLPLPGRAITRCYSLSDRPDAAAWRITVKRMLPPPGRPELPPGAASNHFHDQVHAGDVLRVKAPTGRFFIDPDASVPAVFIAGGIGITPMMSMLLWCLAEQPGRRLHLYYGVRSSAEQAFKPLLEKLAEAHSAFTLYVVCGEPGPDDGPGRDHPQFGFIDLALLKRTLPHGRHQFYVCGPPPMMQSLVPGLRDWGVQEGDIHFEAFGPASPQPATAPGKEPPATGAQAIDIRFSRSGRTLVWDGRDANLLDCAERQGLAVESGCRSGSCGSCETRLVSGQVDYAERPDHAVAPGHCLLCVGRPRSALVLEA